ncbi:hypothetical protein FOA52_000172 [Chlamydomonas sp. UWO 241]|nr:hypothetical protein FOA52_000172 [Chlamydomonas sp. UWO 241]
MSAEAARSGGRMGGSSMGFSAARRAAPTSSYSARPASAGPVVRNTTVVVGSPFGFGGFYPFGMGGGYGMGGGTGVGPVFGGILQLLTIGIFATIFFRFVMMFAAKRNDTPAAKKGGDEWGNL